MRLKWMIPKEADGLEAHKRSFRRRLAFFPTLVECTSGKHWIWLEKYWMRRERKRYSSFLMKDTEEVWRKMKENTDESKEQAAF